MAGALLVGGFASMGAVMGRHAHQSAAKGTVTFAGYPGEGPSFLFPMYTSANWDVGYVPWFSYVMWPPLYVWGQNGHPVFSVQHSLANAPVFRTNLAGDTVATITLKPWQWSDGRPVTTRDVEFWMRLLDQEKANWGPYVPGQFPDNVKAITYVSARTFIVTFNAKYSTHWLLGNELSQITPIPQHAWDRVSATGPVGNYDFTTAGARRVYAYLMGQAKTLTTYSTNPLWKVVDGAWEISAYDPTTQYTSFSPNPVYSGVPKPRIKRFIEVPFTSDASEFNSLEAGQLDYGYVPLADLNTIPALKAKGYRIVRWAQDAWGGILLNYAPRDAQTPILKQLYVRQAMTHLVDVTAILRVLEHGLGYYAAGPVPNPGGSGADVTRYAKHDPYPFSVDAARQLLASHGWKVIPGGTTTCERPGSGAHECGAGVRKGAPMQFTFLTSESTSLNSGITQLLTSDFTRAGLVLAVRSEPISTLYASAGACIGARSCSWQLANYLELWPLGWPGWVPGASTPFGCGSGGNYLNWCDPETQRLASLTHTSSSPSALAAFENYIAKEQPLIFLPMPVFRVSAIRGDLRGVTPQDPYLDIYPNQWYYAG